MSTEHPFQRAARETAELLEELVGRFRGEPLLISPQEKTVLEFIAANERQTLRDVVEALEVDKATLCRIVDELESRRLVMRTRSVEDRRLIELALTAEGTRVLKQPIRVDRETLVEAFRGRPDASRYAFVQFLRRAAELVR